jgi:hypothetical protein
MHQNDLGDIFSKKNAPDAKKYRPNGELAQLGHTGHTGGRQTVFLFSFFSNRGRASQRKRT